MLVTEPPRPFRDYREVRSKTEDGRDTLDTLVNILFLITGLRVIAYGVVVGAACLVTLAVCGLGAVALARHGGGVESGGLGASKEG